MTFWNWGLITIWHSIESVAFFLLQNHSTKQCAYTALHFNIQVLHRRNSNAPSAYTLYSSVRCNSKLNLKKCTKDNLLKGKRPGKRINHQINCFIYNRCNFRAKLKIGPAVQPGKHLTLLPGPMARFFRQFGMDNFCKCASEVDSS